MVTNGPSLAKQVVKEQYEERMQKRLTFVQVFLERIQEVNITEVFKCTLTK